MEKPSFRLEDIKLEDLGKNIEPKVLAEGTVGKDNPGIIDARHCDAEDFCRTYDPCDKAVCPGYDYKCPCEDYEPSGECSGHVFCGDF